MAIIQIKRISSHPYGADGTDLLYSLCDGELGYIADENKLYIGYDGENILINDSSGLGPLLEEIKKNGIGRLSWDPDTLELRVYDIDGTQVNSKYVNLNHTHNYAGAASAGGAANAAIKLVAANGEEISVGGTDQPIYFLNGIPTPCGDTLNVNVSKNAATASQLAESRTFTIGGTAADGGTSFNGSSNVTLKIPKILNGFTSIASSKFIGNLEGNATSADKLSTENVGGSNKPVHFTNGIPVECGDQLDVNITKNAATASQLANPRTISISDTSGTTGTSFDGSKNISLVIPSILKGFSSITSSKFIGDLQGNADTALNFKTEKSIALEGDVIGSGSSTGGWTIPTVLKDLHTTEGQGGPAENKTLAASGTFTVPYFEYDKNGRITAVIDRTYTLPADNNTDTKVTQKAVITTAKEYPIMLGYDDRTTAVTNTINKASGFTYNPSTKVLTAPTFKGALVGNADTATVWHDGRTFSINGSAADGGVVVDGSKDIALKIPKVIDGFTSISATKFIGALEGVADEAKKLSSSAGSNVKPIYFAEGIPVECGDTLNVDINGNSATSDHWKNTITLTYTNDVTGTATFDGSANKNVSLTLKNSGVTANTYGPSANTVLDFSSQFTVPKYTVDAKGRITAASNVLYTLPNIGVYVNNLTNQTIAPNDKIYKFTALDDLSFDDADNQINATENEYILNLEDFAHTSEVQDKIDAIPKPMIFKGTVGNSDATIETLPTASAATIGHTYRVIASMTVDGVTSTPGDLWICAKIKDIPETYKWVHVINTDETHVSSAAQADKWTNSRKFTISGTPSTSIASVDGSKDVTLYLPTTIGKFTKVSATTFEGALSGNATTATTATKLGTNAGDSDTPVYFANGVPVACDSTLDVNIKGTSAGWTTGRKITLTGPVDGNVTIDGSKDVSITTTIDDIYLFNSGDTITGHLTFSNNNAQSGQPGLKWKTIGTANPYVGYATDQTDGTFALMSIEGTTYASGLAIGGSSKNLLWKGKKIATIEDGVASAGQLTTSRKISISGTPGTTGTLFNGSTDISLILPLTIGKFDKVSSTSFEGNLSGNATSATAFKDNATITLTGDITGSGSGKNGWSIETTLANTTVTAGNYGPSENKTLAHSGTFTVPYVEVDSKGRITGAYNRTYTLPTDNNTDTKVTQAYSTGNASYPLLFTATSGITSTSSRGATTAILNNSIYANPSTGAITANKFIGPLQGNADTSTSWSSSRKVTFNGDVSGSFNIDGSADVNCTLTVADNSHSHSNYMSSSPTSIELNTAGSLASYGGFIDFHYHDKDKNPLNIDGTIAASTPDYTSRIIEDAAGQISINGTKFKTGLVTATKFKGNLEGTADKASQLAEGRKISISGTPGTSGTTFNGSTAIELILPLTIGKFTKVSADSFEGALSGNASSATAFSSNATVKLTGAVTGEASSTKGWTIDTTLTPIHTAEGSGGPSENKTLAASGEFTVPYFEYDVQGRITSVVDRTYTLPADKNTDTKVTQSAAITTDGEYPVILGYSTATTSVTNTVKKTTTLKYNPSTQILTAPTFKGYLNGNADTASTWATSRNFSISQTAATTDATNGTPKTVAVDGSLPVVLEVPTIMNGFTSITSDKFIGQASRALKLETYTNSSKTTTYGTSWQLCAYWETDNDGKQWIRLASDQSPTTYGTRVDHALKATKATLADAATTWETSRYFSISDYTDTNQGVNSSVNGSVNVDLKMPKNIEVSTISVNKSETTGTGVQMKYDATDESLMFVFA